MCNIFIVMLTILFQSTCHLTESEPTSAGAVMSINADVAVAIAVVSITAVIMVGVLTGILLYYCISKQRSQSSGSKPEAYSHQQQQTDPEYEEVSATSGGEKNELSRNVAYEPVQKIEMRDNVAYGPVQKIEMRDNVAYGPVQH